MGAAALAVVAMALTVARSTQDWTPTTDWALIEWQVRHVNSSLPMLGAPSATGFHHPGPLPYLVLAPLYRLFGTDPQALALATGALACATVAAIGATAWRRGGLLPTLAATTTVVWLAGSLPAGTLVDPWNPWVALLPFVWLVVLVWSVLDDDLWAVPFAALCASFVVQAHVGYVVPVVALGVLVAVSLVLRWRRAHPTDEGHRSRNVALATVAVLIAAWALPLCEEATASDGNLSRLLAYATDGSASDRAPLGDGLRLVAAEMGWPGPWLTGHEQLDNLSGQAVPSSWWYLVGVAVALTLAWWMARDDRTSSRLVAVAAVTITSVAVAILLVEEGRAFPYALRLAWPASASVGLALLVAAAGRLGRWRPHTLPALSAVGALLLIVASTRLVATGTDASLPAYRPDQRSLEVACLDQLLPAIIDRADGGPVHIEQVEYWPTWSGPIANELDRDGVAVSVDPRLGFHLQLDGRAADADDLALVVVDDPLIAAWEVRADAEELVRCQLLDENERAMLDSLEDRFARGELNVLDQLKLFDLTLHSAETAVFVRTG